MLKDLKEHLKSSLESVYLIYGSSSFLRKESLNMIINKVGVPESSKDFNQNSFYAGNVKVNQFIESISTLPFLCDKRLVICQDVHQFSEKDWKFIFPIIKDPIQTTVLVLIASNLDKRKRISKLLIDSTFAVETATPKGYELTNWTQWLAKRHQVNMTPPALQLLIQLTGSTLEALNNEIQKLKMIQGHSDQILEEKDILEAVARVKQENVFAFTEAIGKKDLKSSFRYLIHLLEDGENEVGLLALLARHVRILSQVGRGVKEGKKAAEISRQAGISYYYFKNYASQVELWNEKKIKQMVEVLHETDRAMKSSPLSSDIWMENFVFKACSI